MTHVNKSSLGSLTIFKAVKGPETKLLHIPTLSTLISMRNAVCLEPSENTAASVQLGKTRREGNAGLHSPGLI